MDTKAVSILKLKLKLESKLKKRKELDSQIKSIKKEMEELEEEESSVKTEQEKLFKMIESLPEKERKHFNREYSYTCPMCRNTYDEGFNIQHEMDMFYGRHPELKEYSAYCLSHTRFSKCYKNQFCSICESRGDDYTQFIYKTDRTRHVKKHKEKGEKVLINKNEKSISELKHMFREKAKKQKRCIVIPKKQSPKDEEIYEQEEKEEEDRVNKINEQRQEDFEQQQDIMRNRMYKSTVPDGWTEEDEKQFQLIESLGV